MRHRYLLLLTALAVGLAGLLGLQALLPAAETASPYTLLYAQTNDHAQPQPLDGATVTGGIYPFTTPDAGVEDVTFFLDGVEVRTEDNPPFDFAGGTSRTASPWDTTQVADGEHTIAAELLLSDGATVRLQATFTVANQTAGEAPPTETVPADADQSMATAEETPDDGAAEAAVTAYSLAYSLSANRVAPQVLDGATVSGDVYVFTTPAEGVEDVTFALDGRTVWTEDNPPFDFMGGNTDYGNPWRTKRVGDGEHTISAELLLKDGSVLRIAAVFTVDNGDWVEEPSPTEEPNPTGTEEPGPSPTEEQPTSTSTEEEPGGGIPLDYGLVYSTGSNRSNPAALHGAMLSGTVYVFINPDTNLHQVRFLLDGEPVRTESDTPFDLMGTNGATAHPWDTTKVADGAHTLSAQLTLIGGITATVSAEFTVNNGATPPEEPQPEPPPSGGGGGSTQISTGKMLGGGYNPEWFYVRSGGGSWQPTYAGAALQGRLMNFRAANAIFDDERRSDDNPDANTNAFIANFADYKAHGILAMTVSLQGGNPGYEGALASAFNPDGSLKGPWMDRAGRVIEAADRHGMVIILTYYYQRQDQVLRDEAAVKRGIQNATDWLIANNYRNVIIEIANEYQDGGFNHDIINRNTVNGGIGELINLAKSRFNGKGWRLPVTASAGIWFTDGLAQTADVAMVHGNGHRDWEGTRDTYESMRRIVENSNVPVVMNEDDNGTTPNSTTLSRDTHALDDAIRAGGSWGLMWKPYNQLYPFGWSLGNPGNVNTEAGYFHAILDVIQDRVY